MLNTITRAIILIVATFALCVPAKAQYSANYQTNIISAVTSNWPGDYIVGSNYVFDVLQIVNGGYLSDESAYIGFTAAASNNSVQVNAGAVWGSVSNILIGYSGAANSLTVGSGGGVYSSAGYVGYNISSSNNLVVVSGNSSVWNSGEDLYIGYSGRANSLIISSGGNVFAQSPHIGENTSSSNNTVIVTGSGSVWNNSDTITVGYYGSGNTLTIANSGTVYSAYGNLGVNGGASNIVLVSGSGSVWNNSHDIEVSAGSGSGNTLSIANSGTVYSANGYLGYNDGLIVVAGSGSVWSNRNKLYIGYWGSHNEMIITNGGVVYCGQGSFGVGGSDNGDNMAVVIGDGSAWKIATNLYVGYAGAGNALTIADNGLVTARNIYIGFLSSSIGNQITLSGGNLTVTNVLGNSVLEVRRGRLTLNNGIVTADQFVATNASSVIFFNGGTFSVRNSVVNNGYVFNVGDGTHAAMLNLYNGTHSFTNGLFIATNATLAGTGQILGSVTAAGLVASGQSIGTLGITGSYTQTVSGSLNVRIAGATTYDKLTVSDTALFSGTLNVVTNGYAPHSGESFMILTAGSLSGAFVTSTRHRCGQVLDGAFSTTQILVL